MLLTQRHATGLGERYLPNRGVWASPETFRYARTASGLAPLLRQVAEHCLSIVRVVMPYGYIAYTSWRTAPTPPNGRPLAGRWQCCSVVHTTDAGAMQSHADQE